MNINRTTYRISCLFRFNLTYFLYNLMKAINACALFFPLNSNVVVYIHVCVLLAQFLLEVRFVFAYLNGIRSY